jgi:hypothetical protein
MWVFCLAENARSGVGSCLRQKSGIGGWALFGVCWFECTIGMLTDF